jgi:hypothetical protein
VIIAHGFAYAFVNRVSVLGHRCSNPLCQRVAPGASGGVVGDVESAGWALRRTHSRIRAGRGRGPRCCGIWPVTIRPRSLPISTGSAGRPGSSWDCGDRSGAAQCARRNLWPHRCPHSARSVADRFVDHRMRDGSTMRPSVGGPDRQLGPGRLRIVAATGPLTRATFQSVGHHGHAQCVLRAARLA